MFKTNRGLVYLLCLFPVIIFIAFGLLKMNGMNRSNQDIRSSIHNDQVTMKSLDQQQRETTLTNYEKGMSQQGANLYQSFPQADQDIKAIVNATYGKIQTQSDYEQKTTKITKMMKGSFPQSVLDNIKPQLSQASQKPMSPYGSVKDVRVDNRFNNYNQGNVIVMSDVSYTVPSKTVTDGRTFTLPSEHKHDYYLSSYNVADHQLDVWDTNHSQRAQGGDE